MKLTSKNRKYLLFSLLISTLICSYPFYKRQVIDSWILKHKASAYYTYEDWVGKLPDFAREVLEDIDVLIMEEIQIEDFDNINSLKKLRILNIEHSTVDNPQAILKMKNLEVLHCTGSNLSDELLDEFRIVNSKCEINAW